MAFGELGQILDCVLQDGALQGRRPTQIASVTFSQKRDAEVAAKHLK